MKAKYYMSIFFSTALSASAYGASALPIAPLLCTRDFNPWGQGSRCACPEESIYEQRIGRCLVGALEPQTAEGLISTSVSAIGGETSGVVLQTSADSSYELILTRALKTRLEQGQLEGIQYKVEGDFLTVPGVESGDRATLIVTKLTPLEAAPN